MKFSRFKFSEVLNVFILTQPVNIVKRFFLFVCIGRQRNRYRLLRLCCHMLYLLGLGYAGDAFEKAPPTPPAKL